MQENSLNGAGLKFQRLVEIMARLRAPGGCPWDREQTFDSIKPYTLEETYEVLDAIDRRVMIRGSRAAQLVQKFQKTHRIPIVRRHLLPPFMKILQSLEFRSASAHISDRNRPSRKTTPTAVSTGMKRMET